MPKDTNHHPMYEATRRVTFRQHATAPWQVGRDYGPYRGWINLHSVWSGGRHSIVHVDNIRAVLTGLPNEQVDGLWLVDGPEYLDTLECLGNAWADGQSEAGSPTCGIPQWAAGHAYSLYCQTMADCWFGMD